MKPMVNLKILTGLLALLAYSSAFAGSGCKPADDVFNKVWRDANGSNTFSVRIDEIASTQQNRFSDDSVNAIELETCHWVENRGERRLLRRLFDYVQACPVDFKLVFVEESFKITDLDQDGISELSFLYLKACRGDVSPATAKFMLLTNGEKYPIRGTAVMEYLPETHRGTYGGNGAYVLGEEFEQGGSAYKQFALEQWRRYAREAQP